MEVTARSNLKRTESRSGASVCAVSPCSCARPQPPFRLLGDQLSFLKLPIAFPIEAGEYLEMQAADICAATVLAWTC